MTRKVLKKYELAGVHTWSETKVACPTVLAFKGVVSVAAWEAIARPFGCGRFYSTEPYFWAMILSIKRCSHLSAPCTGLRGGHAHITIEKGNLWSVEYQVLMEIRIIIFVVVYKNGRNQEEIKIVYLWYLTRLMLITADSSNL
jgi:hypothetical protein